MRDQKSYSGKIDRKTLRNMLNELESIQLIKTIHRRMNGLNPDGSSFSSIGNNIVLWKGISEDDPRV